MFRCVINHASMLCSVLREQICSSRTVQQRATYRMMMNTCIWGQTTPAAESLWQRDSALLSVCVCYQVLAHPVHASFKASCDPWCSWAEAEKRPADQHPEVHPGAVRSVRRGKCVFLSFSRFHVSRFRVFHFSFSGVVGFKAKTTISISDDTL